MTDDVRPNGFWNVLGWMFALGTIAAGVACYLQLDVLKQAEATWFSLGARIPGITSVFVNHGWWLLTIIPIAIVLLLVYIMFTATGAMFRIGVAAVACLIVCALAGLAYAATKYPLDQIQKQLS